MTSDFNVKGTIPPDDDLIPIGRKGGRFEFYKVRIYGVLHFVKKIAPQEQSSLLSSEVLRKEFAIGYSLNHPNIVRYLQFDGDAVYEEYIDGTTLRELIDKEDGRIGSSEFVLKICRQILEALVYLHGQGIVHLDLKPENIMVTRIGGDVKIIDFGSALNSCNDTTPGFTLDYMAPEQAESDVNITTDIYQVGKILDEITPRRLKKKWKRFIDKATAYHPSQRFESAEEALQSLPKFEKGKILRPVFMILCLAFGAIGVILFFNKTDLPENSENKTKDEIKLPLESEKKDTIKTIIREEIKTPIVPVEKIPADYEIEKEISNQIYSKLDELLSVKVTPLYEKMMKDKEFKQQNDHEFIESYSQVFNQIREYGNELGEKYPEKTDYINERIMRIYETKIYLMTENLYPRISPSQFQPREGEVADTL